MQFTHFYKISDLFVKIIKSLNLSPLSIFSFDPIDPNISNNILFKTIEINSKFDRTILDSYSKVPHVEASGEFSMIGDTYIIFIKDTEIILRIELFGESVEKISILDSLTLRKNINISKAYIAYFTEFNETNSNYLISYNIELEPQSIINFFANKSLKHEDLYFPLPIYTNKEKLWETDLVRYIREEYRLIYYGQNIESFKQKLNESVNKEFLKGMLSSIFEKDTEKERDTRIKVFIENVEYNSDNEADKGFYSNKEKIVVITDQEIFGTLFFKSSIQNKNISKLFDGEINIDDYIVHDLHGIGIYKGLITQEISGESKDYIKIEYLNNDILYVPYETVDKVSKFIGEGGQPKLTRLGSAEWDTIRAKAKKDIEEIASELLDLYARREMEKGFAYDMDKTKEMFEQFIYDFGYDDTPDQKRTTNEVLEDMESEKPMDRLVVGDVGFGKTEIAIRAAFLAVLNHKQVVILAPTTILVSQLFKVFSERLSKYGVVLAKVSRFEGNKRNKESIKLLETGSVDIIVGTHRLLSKDVKAKDLGILIIDEEQRFGVKQKESIKELKANVDVLSMSATPIPRTLQMSLSGIRDISVIATPPVGRLPVTTKLISRGDMYAPIIQEIERGGQVFIVHNNISTIHTLEQKIKEKVPGVKILVGHAKMSGTKLEKIMLDFSDKKSDVLLATTIIENGIDIPSVNTMIINEATHFGLSQLHQLRGRVGRSSTQAFCYLVVPYKLENGQIDDTSNKHVKVLDEYSDEEESTDNKQKEVTIDGVERIKALVQYQQLGSGFHIASKDLEIRGSGNVLGASQSGHISSMGYDMYLRMLYQEIEKKKKKHS